MGTIQAPGGPYGQRLIPNIIDECSKSSPERLYAVVPLSRGGKSHYQKITMKDLSAAVNHTAWWIDHNLGRSSSFETLAYMGPADVRYGIYFIAAIKCGYKVLPLKSQAANIEHFVIEELEDLLVGPPAPHFGYKKSHSDSVRDPVLICHTSGSTGAPKPIVLPHGAFSVIDNQRRLSKSEGRLNMDYSLFDLGGKPFVNTFPGYHVGGMVAIAALPIYYNTTVVMVPHERPANGEMLAEILSQTRVGAIFSPPSVVEELLNIPGGLEQLSKLEFVMYGGGPLSPAVGESISAVTSVVSVIGSTECGIIPARVPHKDDWNYFEFNPEYEVRMVHVADDIYELTIPNPPRLGWIHTVYHTFPDIEIWHTNDHYRQHPEKPNLFTFIGRGDDVIVLSNGEKFQPVTTESIVQNHPDINGALVAGTARFQPLLIIEPWSQPSDTEAFIDHVWPIIEKANQNAAGHGRIFRGKVLLTSSAKPFLRSPKGTIIRAKSAALYEAEIEALFADSAENQDFPALSSAQVQSFDTVRDAVGHYIRSVLPDLSPGINGDIEDFFAIGLDSVRSIELSNGLRALFRPHLPPETLSKLAVKVIYAHSSIESLSRQICQMLQLTNLGNDNDRYNERAVRMAAMLSRYTTEVVNNNHQVTLNQEVALPKHEERQPPGLFVVLTGTTGSLGAQLLYALLQDREIGKIVCLNRGEDGRQRTIQRLGKHAVELDHSHVQFHKVQLGADQLGLDSSTYASVGAQMDVIIHNAWKVDFNQALQSFEDQVRGVRDLVDWTSLSVRHPRIMFVSSVSSVGQWSAIRPQDTEIPEASLLDVGFDVSLPMGYGESKHIAECMLAITAEKKGCVIDILRLGQIAGPISQDGGAWSRSEWFPALVKTCKSLGQIPDRLMPVDWIPVDILADVIVELLHHEHDGTQTYNLLNPHRRTWEELTPVMQSSIGGKVVTLASWIEQLQNVDASNASEVESKPALKILEWFTGLEKFASSGKSYMSYATSCGTAASQTLSKMPPVNGSWLKHWLKKLSDGETDI